MVKNGIVDIGFGAPGYTPGRFPLISVADSPLMFKSGKGGSQGDVVALPEAPQEGVQRRQGAVDLGAPARDNSTWPGSTSGCSKTCPASRSARPGAMLTTMVKTARRHPGEHRRPRYLQRPRARAWSTGRSFPGRPSPASSWPKCSAITRWQSLRLADFATHEPAEVREPAPRPPEGHRRSERRLGGRVHRRGVGPERAGRHRSGEEGRGARSTRYPPRSASAGSPGCSRWRTSG